MKLAWFGVMLLLLLAILSPAGADPVTQPATAPTTRNDAENWVASFQRDQDGFTNFPLGHGARVVLISTSEGSDAHDGYEKPVRTLKKATSLLRSGFPDRLLFKRGDVFDNSVFNDVIQRHGRDPMEPMILGAYGDAKKPRPVLTAQLGLGGRESHPSFLVLQDLDFYADTRDPASPGFSADHSAAWQGFGIYQNDVGKYLWIEGCRFRSFYTDICLQSHDKNKECYHNLVIRRCVVADAFGVGGGHAQGLYLENFDNVLIEEDVFDHNGWNEQIPRADKTIFNHDIYIQHGDFADQRRVVVRNNIIARASSHGLQMRPGGLMKNNLFLKNPLSAFVSYGDSVVRDNVVLDGDNIGPNNPRGQGFELLNCPSVLMDGNIIAHKKDPANGMSAINIHPLLRDAPAAYARIEVSHNIVYDWAGPALSTQSLGATLAVHDNIFQCTAGHTVELHDLTPAMQFTGNRYLTSKAQPFRIKQQDMDSTGWKSLTGEAVLADPVSFVDPDRDVAAYAKTMQMDPPTLETFLGACREQARFHWDSRLTADAVNKYVRAGFAAK